MGNGNQRKCVLELDFCGSVVDRRISWLDDGGRNHLVDSADALASLDSVVAVFAPSWSPGILDLPVRSRVAMAPGCVVLDSVADH